MAAKRETTLGRFTAPISVANHEDITDMRRKKLPAAKVRRITIDGVVDSGAVRLVRLGPVVKHLGLPITGKAKVHCADGRRRTRDTAEVAYVELLGRHGTFTAVVEPKRRAALIGAIVLEDLD